MDFLIEEARTLNRKIPTKLRQDIVCLEIGHQTKSQRFKSLLILKGQGCLEGVEKQMNQLVRRKKKTSLLSSRGKENEAYSEGVIEIKKIKINESQLKIQK